MLDMHASTSVVLAGSNLRELMRPALLVGKNICETLLWDPASCSLSSFVLITAAGSTDV